MFRQLIKTLGRASIGRLVGLSPRHDPDDPDDAPTKERLLEIVRAGDDADNDARLSELLDSAPGAGLLAEAGLAPLFTAARLEHWRIAEKLARQMDLEAAHRHGDTALIAASARGQTKLVRLLLDCKASGAATNDTGDTALIAATRNGDADTVQALLDAKVSPDAMDSAGRTALLIATQLNRAPLVAALLEADANPDQAGPNQPPPLTVAIKSGSEPLASQLLVAGAAFDADDSGRSLLAEAIERGMNELAGQMLDHVSAAAREALQPDIADWLREALRPGNDALVEILATRASPDTLATTDASGRTLLMLALEYGREAAARRLLTAGANPNQWVHDNSAALAAADRGDARSLSLLNEWEADFNTANAAGVTSLERAVVRGHTQAVAFLAGNGASLNRQDRFGATALMLAVDRERESIIQALLDAGADPNIANGTGMTPLHRVASRGARAGMDSLLQAGARLEARDNSGKTPLEVAYALGNHQMVAALRQRGAIDLVGSIQNSG